MAASSYELTTPFLKNSFPSTLWKALAWVTALPLTATESKPLLAIMHSGTKELKILTQGVAACFINVLQELPKIYSVIVPPEYFFVGKELEV